MLPAHRTLRCVWQVEGFEPKVIRGASELLKKRTPKAVLLEYSPGVAEALWMNGINGNPDAGWAMSREYPAMLDSFHAAGYTALASARATVQCRHKKYAKK